MADRHIVGERHVTINDQTYAPGDTIDGPLPRHAAWLLRRGLITPADTPTAEATP